MAKQILILEDENMVAMLLEESFTEKGHEVDISLCNDGQPEKVVSELENSLANETIDKPDFAVVDGLNGGYKPAGEILEKYKIPYAVFSGTQAIVDEVKGRGLPAFEKPEGRESLVAYINSL